MERKKYVRLTFSERVKIETLLGENISQIKIAKKLNRSRSTISNELKNWNTSLRNNYDAALAHEFAKIKNEYKRTTAKITLSNGLKIQVFRGLLSKLSPELISGRLKLLYPNNPEMNISYESIYRYIYNHPQGLLNKKLIKLLVREKPRRRKNKRRNCNQKRISEGISIEQRPESIEDRKEAGHWEGDLLIGPKQSSCIGSIVERKTRYSILVKLEDKKSITVCSAFAKKLNMLPELFKKTMTYDNGTEMAEHKLLTKQTGMDIYFAHPYSSWERGSNENANGLVRRTFSKKTDFAMVNKYDLMKLQDHLNNRPRKVLGYYTSNEMFQFELRKNRDYDNYDMGLEMGNKSPKDLFSFLMPFVDKINYKKPKKY